ncbi:uncharacterized protein LOC113234864 [Hyposmocoma kahamanoa]|uniref:uncharacterized protein LOC113234864 n=1 Tax=Hyposmocoma kahamanoa TaxID=1477025 RepID=UPI000E6D907B|nr:uncharacterized protein LOC113234864 [Hyposmocoma kahamanoa]
MNSLFDCRNLIVNPAFGKRSIDDSEVKPISIRELHEVQKNRSYLYNLEENSIKFHREGRQSLYEKLETFFKLLGYNGKECVLRSLCESSRLRAEQGTFLEEIMRATFTFPRRNKASDVHEEYDLAHGRPGDCARLYPECNDMHGNVLYK